MPESYSQKLVCYKFPFSVTYEVKQKIIGKSLRKGRWKASPVAQLLKNPPAMQETPVQFLGWEDPLEKG